MNRVLVPGRAGTIGAAVARRLPRDPDHQERSRPRIGPVALYGLQPTSAQGASRRWQSQPHRLRIASMTALDPGNGKVLRTDAAGCQVGDVMVRNPKTVSVETSVSQLRGLFENDHVHAALLVDGDRFAGVIAPEDLPATATASEPARAYARRNVPAVGPDTEVADALAVMDTRGDRRLVVLGPDGTKLVGLLCLDKSGSNFCVGDHR